MTPVAFGEHVTGDDPEERIRIIRSLEISVITAAAGTIGEIRAMVGSEPGWRRVRSRAELTAIHEGCHAVVSYALGQTPYLATVAASPRAHGAVFYAPPADSAEPWAGVDAGSLATDGQSVRRTVRVLAKYAGIYLGDPARSRRPLVVLRALRAETVRLVEDNWYLITYLAVELLKHKTLSRDEIAAIVAPHVRFEIPSQ